MKKLLLVMLVPVLVLGVMGCGGVKDGSAAPTALQGAWSNTGFVSGDVDGVPFIYIVGNQMTIDRNPARSDSKLVFRISYEGEEDEEDGWIRPTSGDNGFKITLFEYDSKYAEIGTLICNNAARIDQGPSSFSIYKIEYPSDRTYYSNLLNQFFKIGKVYTRI